MMLWQINSQVTKAQPQQPGTHAVRTSYSKEGGKRLFWTLAVIWSSNSSWERGQTPALLVTAGWQILPIKVIDKLLATLSNCFPPTSELYFYPAHTAPDGCPLNSFWALNNQFLQRVWKQQIYRAVTPTRSHLHPHFSQAWRVIAKNEAEAPWGRTEHGTQGESPHTGYKKIWGFFLFHQPSGNFKPTQHAFQDLFNLLLRDECVLWELALKTSEGTTHMSIRAPNKVLTATQVQSSFLTEKAQFTILRASASLSKLV